MRDSKKLTEQKKRLTADLWIIALVTMAGSFPAIRTVLRLRPAEVLHGGH